MAAGLLAALAILTKQTFVAALVAGSVWLWRRHKPSAVLYGGTATSVVLLTAAVYELQSHAFLANVVLANANPYRLDVLRINLAVWGAFQLGPLVLVATMVGRRSPASTSASAVLARYYWLAALIPLAGLGKVGANHNYWIELAAATAVLASWRVWEDLWPTAASARRTLLCPILILALTPMLWVNAAGTLRSLAGDARFQPEAAAPDMPGGAEIDALVMRVRDEPREVLAEPLDVIALADRPILLEPFVYQIMERGRHWDAAPIVQHICDGRVGLLVLGYSLEDAAQRGHNNAGFWSPSILHALRQTMRYQGIEAGRYVYVPDEAATCAPR